MKRLDEELSRDVLKSIGFCGGANLGRFCFDCGASFDAGRSHTRILIDICLECSPVVVRIEMRDVISFSVSQKSCGQHFGFSGHPESLMLAWSENRVVLAFNSVVDDDSYESLKAADCFVEAAEIHYEILGEPGVT